jgi:CheY-like chemotaxis protein
LEAATKLRPDVVLAVIGMPSLNGLDAGRRLKQANPKLKLMYLTMSNNVEDAKEVLQVITQQKKEARQKGSLQPFATLSDVPRATQFGRNRFLP